MILPLRLLSFFATQSTCPLTILTKSPSWSTAPFLSRAQFVHVHIIPFFESRHNFANTSRPNNGYRSRKEPKIEPQVMHARMLSPVINLLPWRLLSPFYFRHRKTALAYLLLQDLGRSRKQATKDCCPHHWEQGCQSRCPLVNIPSSCVAIHNLCKVSKPPTFSPRCVVSIRRNKP